MITQKVIIVAHGGAGSPPKLQNVTRNAVNKAYHTLKRTKSALQSAVAGAVVLEDDPRFNAGTGSYFRLDGHTIEMDAAVMDSQGHLGAVAGIQRVKNPVKVAYTLTKSPYNFICGDGAIRFARLNGFPDYDPLTPQAQRVWHKRLRQIRRNKLPGWASGRWVQKYLAKYSTETIGVVVSDGRNNFAIATSTGGISLALPGRVGDTPLVGCGFYAGKYGAVLSTGVGEEITRKMLAREVYDKIRSGFSPQEACEWGVRLFPKKVPVGVIAVSHNEYGISANTQMPVSILIRKIQPQIKYG